MKKLITLMVGFAIFVSTSNAKIYHVDALGGTSGGTAETWATAVKSIDQAAVLAAANGGVDDIYVKTGTILITGSFIIANDVNLYGGFQGIEGETPVTRAMFDTDRNGITEPWEFQYPTLIDITRDNSGVTLGTSIMNGFSISHKGTKAGTFNTIVGIAGTTFENNIVKNCVLNYTVTGTTLYASMMMKVIGTFRNCLIEKNTVNVIGAAGSPATVTPTDKYYTPLVDVLAGGYLTNCTVRNNKVKIDYTGASAYAVSSVKGLILNVYGNAVGNAKVANCLIHNNEATYLGGGGTPAGTATAIIPNGTIVSLTGLSTQALTDSVVNNTIANNKIYNTGNGGVFATQNSYLINNFLNNVLWNNTLDSLGLKVVVKNLNVNAAVTTGRIGYNVMNGGNWGGYVGNPLTANNLFDLNTSNTDASTGASFKNPTTAIGINRVAGSADSIAIAQADWRLGSALSYIFGKGVVTSIKTDKAGKNFASIPSVGAFEFDASIAAVIPVNQNVATLAYARDGKIISKQEGKLQIFNLTGSVVWIGNVVSEQKIALPGGCYLLRLTSAKEVSNQKVVL